MVNEVWLKLVRTGHWDSRAHFFGSAARAMQQVLAREAQRQQRRVKREREAGLMREQDSPPIQALLDRAADVNETSSSWRPKTPSSPRSP